MSDRGGHPLRLTKQEREEIIEAFLADPIKGTELAVSKGLSAAYAYKVTYERGLLPRARKEWGSLREGLV